MMRGKLALSVSDKLLLAANELEGNGKRPFSAEDLVVAAWRKFPDTFGLAGHRDIQGRLCYPDSNRVFAETMGSKPVRKRGLLIKVGTKMYQLTEAGRERARQLSAGGPEPQTQKAGLGRDMELHLQKILSSRVMEKVRNERPEDLTFYDACAFWGITPRSSAIELDGQLSKLETIVQYARDATHEKTASFGHGGHTFGAQDLDGILRAHRILLDKFRPEIELIRQRKDERRT